MKGKMEELIGTDRWLEDWVPQRHDALQAVGMSSPQAGVTVGRQICS